MESIGGSATKASSLVANDVLVVLAFIAVVIGILVLGIIMGVRIRNSRRRHRDRQIKGEHLSSRKSAGERRAEDGEEEVSDSASASGRRRVRRRRRDHRPRNPTLAESGGLPPARLGDGSSRAAGDPS